MQELLIIARAAAGLLLLQCATAICYSIAPPLGHLISCWKLCNCTLAIAHNTQTYSFSSPTLDLDLEIVVYVSKEQFFFHGFEKGLVSSDFFCKVTKLCSTACSWYALLVDCCILLLQLLLKLLNLIIFTWCQVQLCIDEKNCILLQKVFRSHDILSVCTPQSRSILSAYRHSETIIVHLYLICIYHERRCSSAWRNCIIRRKQISHNISFASIYIYVRRP